MNKEELMRSQLFELELNKLMNKYGYNNLTEMINTIVDSKIEKMKMPSPIMQTKVDAPDLVTYRQLADMCGCSKSSISDKVKQNIFIVEDKNASVLMIHFHDARKKILNNQANLKTKNIEDFKINTANYK